MTEPGDVAEERQGGARTHAKTREAERPRLRDLFAARDAPWIREDGRILVAYERERPALLRWFARLARTPEGTTIVLEKEGARAWELSDGSRTLDAIARILQAEGGEGSEAAAGAAGAARTAAPATDAGPDPAPGDAEDPLAVEVERLRTFAGVLVRHGLLRLAVRPVPDPRPEPGFPPGFRGVVCPRCGRVAWLAGPRGLRYLCPGCHRVARERARAAPGDS